MPIIDLIAMISFGTPIVKILQVQLVIITLLLLPVYGSHCQEQKQLLLPEIRESACLFPEWNFSIQLVNAGMNGPAPAILSRIEPSFRGSPLTYTNCCISYRQMLEAFKEKQYRLAAQYADAVIGLVVGHYNSGMLCEAYMCKAVYEQYEESFEKAIAFYQEAMHYSGDVRRKVEALGNIAIILLSISQQEKALTYLSHADSLFNNLHYDSAQNAIAVWLLCVRAHMLFFGGRVTESVAVYDSALGLSGDMSTSIFILYHKTMLLVQQKSGAERYASFQKLIPYLDIDTLARQQKAFIYVAGGNACYIQKDYTGALRFFSAAMRYMDALPGADRRALLHQLAAVSAARGDYKYAFQLHSLVHRQEDSIKSVRVLKRVTELEGQYRIAEKDQVMQEEQLKTHMAEQRHYKVQIALTGGLLVVVLLLAFLAVRFTYLKERKERMVSQLQAGQYSALLAGEEAEKSRMAQELHDGVYSTMAATHSYLHTFEQLYPHIASDQHFSRLRALLLTTSGQVRSVAHRLAPYDLGKDTFAQAIHDFCKSLFPLSTAVEIQSFGEEYKCSRPDKLILYRLLQELLLSLNEYVSPQELIVMPGFGRGELSLSVEVKGQGMLPPEDARFARIKKRIVQCRGTITVTVQSENAAAIHLCIPATPVIVDNGRPLQG